MEPIKDEIVSTANIFVTDSLYSLNSERVVQYTRVDSSLVMQGGLKMLSTHRFLCCRFVMPEVDFRETRHRANRVES